MRKNVFYSLLAAMVLLAGCAREEISAPVDETQSLTVTLSQTKTHLGDPEGSAPYTHKVYWSNGDKIRVNSIESDALTGLVGTERTATFDFASSLGSAPYNILYPSSIYDDATHVTLPAVQTYKADGFADEMFPMAGYTADGSSITIEHLCAVIQLSVKRATGVSADTDNLVSVTFKGKNSEQVSGSFTIDYGAATLTGASSAAADKSVKVVKTLATATDVAAVYYIVVPAQTYSNGFDIIIQDASGDIMTQSKISSISLVAGKLYITPEIVFVPTGEADPTLTIASAEDLIAFATAYNNKDYDGQDDLVVSLSSNITFDATTSAAFNATGGIGMKDGMSGATEDYYFNGVFDGADYTISGLDATVPLFAGVGSNGVVKDFTLSNTCSLTVGSALRGYYAPVVGWNKGTISGVTSHADVTFNNVYSGADKDNPGSSEIGGLVSHSNGGKIVGCSADGTILCPVAGSFTDFVGYIGGIVGRAGGDGFTVESCSFGGDIKVSNGDFGESDYGGLALSSDGDSKVLYVGGIAGILTTGSINKCVTSASKIIDIRGVFKVQEGGIVGHINSGCAITGSESNNTINRMSVSYKSSGDRKTGGHSPIYIGGIVGNGYGTMERCTNYGEVSTKCQSTTLYLGGMAGSFGGTVEYCTNETTGAVTRTNYADGGQSNRYITMAGCVSSITAASSFNHVVNKATVLSNTLSTSPALTLSMGGIVGGIMGSNTAFVATFQNCENSGTIKVNDATSNTAFAFTALGGILGSNREKATFTDCSNSGLVYCYYNTKNTTATRPSFIGGIVGVLGNQTINSDGDIESMAEIADIAFLRCTNTGNIHNHNFNNANALTSPLLSVYQGGIAGAVYGTSGSKATFTTCKSLNTDSQNIYTYRGYGGGIIGYAKNVSLSDCTVTQELGANANALANAGLCAFMVASSASSCTVSSAIGTTKSVAGLVFNMDATSSLDDCKAQGVTLTSGATEMAVFANTTASGATITDCGASGTIGGSAISMSSTFINTANGVTPTGTYIID